MKLIKKINRVAEELQPEVVADLDQVDTFEKDPEVAKNIKEVEDQAKKDHNEVIKRINRGLRKEPLDKVAPLKEDMEEARLAADQIKAEADQAAAQVLAQAAQEEAAKQAELKEAAKEDLYNSVVSELIQTIWAAIDSYQGATTTLKANEVDCTKLCGLLEEIITQEYIHVGELEELLTSNPAAPNSEEDVIADTVDDVVADEEEVEIEEPEMDVEADELELDDEPAAIDVSDEDLE